MEDWQGAMKLLIDLHGRDRVREEDRIPAWRAIKLLWRCGVSDKDCEELVHDVRKIGRKNTFGPTIVYSLELIRFKFERGELKPRSIREKVADAVQQHGRAEREAARRKAEAKDCDLRG